MYKYEGQVHGTPARYQLGQIIKVSTPIKSNTINYNWVTPPI